MRALSATDLLTVWEQGQGQNLARRALLLLEAACPGTPPDALAALPVGERDGRLLTLRAWTFGEEIVGTALCPGCGERVELTLSANDLCPPGSSLPAERDVHTEGWQVRFRLPNSYDLAAITGCRDVATAREMLLRRCLLSVQREGKEAAPDTLPPPVEDVIVAHMGQSDPQADIRLDLVCPGCQQPWQLLFDTASFFWQEINTWARRVLREVHELAAAYGWREADVLALSPARRQRYLGFVRGQAA